MRRSADATRAPAQVWNGTVVVPEAQKAAGNPTFQYATGYAGTHAALTPAKAPSSGSQPGDHTEQITSAMFTPISGVMQHLNLSDDDIRELAAIIKRLLREGKFPFSPEARRWKELLEKLDPEAIKPREPSPRLRSINRPAPRPPNGALGGEVRA